MNVIVQIPSLNEEEQLPTMLAELPRALPGAQAVQWLLIDDGSSDGTVRVAREHGIDHVVRLRRHKGLAAAFQSGVDACLKLGADVIVNMDADCQFDAADIPSLIAPIVAQDADMVIGDRRNGTVACFSRRQELLRRIGDAVVRRVSATTLPDVTCGFRAYSREAALRLQVLSTYTYTLETIVQAGSERLALAHVPVSVRPAPRPSRLLDSVWAYVARNASSLARIYLRYRPCRCLLVGLAATAVIAATMCARLLYLWLFQPGPGGEVPFMVLATSFTVASLELAALAIVGHALGWGHALELQSLERVKRVELELGVRPSCYEPGGRALAGAPAPGPPSGGRSQPPARPAAP